MPRGPSAVYSVVHIGGLRVQDLRINDDVMQKALAGDENYCKNISMAFRERIKKDSGRDPGWIDFNYMIFTKVRDVPASDVKPKR